MDAYFASFTFWHWWLVGLILIALELFAPGSIFLWTGIAALTVGGVMLFVPMHWGWQFLLFGVLAIASVVAWRAYHRLRPIESDEPLLNRRGEQYIGRVLTLTEPINDRVGRVKLGDSVWKISGRDLPAGTTVRVTAVDGTILRVEKIEKN